MRSGSGRPRHTRIRGDRRGLAGRVLAREDYFPTTTRLLDDWAVASGVLDAMTVDGTSFWYRRRLWAWRWLHECLIYIGILDEIAHERPLAAVALPDADDQALLDAVHLVAQRDGLEVVGQPASRSERGESQAGESDGASAARPAAGAASGLRGVLRELLHRTRLRPSDRRRQRIVDRRDAMDRRLDSFAAEGGRRLLAVIDPDSHQEISTATGTHPVDPFLGPILERLADGPLDPIVVELGSRTAGPPALPAAVCAGRPTRTPAHGRSDGSTSRRHPSRGHPDGRRVRPDRMAGRGSPSRRPGRRGPARDHPPVASGLPAARSSGEPAYTRPDVRLRRFRAPAVDRDGGYRPDEVVVSGSPRLDLRLDEIPDGDRQRHRAELGSARRTG